MALTQGLRSDFRQWLIYDDESTGAVMRGLEAFAMHIVGGSLQQNQNIALRGIGTLMKRTATTRMAEMKSNGGAQEVVASHLTDIFTWLSRTSKGIHTPPPEDQIDEIYAVAFRLDSRIRAAGTAGPGAHRAAARGD